MKSLFFAAWILIAFCICTSGQTLTDSVDTPHLHASTNIIDGAKNPELIPDTTAFRLFLVTVTDATDASPEEKTRHENIVGRIKFTNTDRVAFDLLRAGFRSQYDELIKSYNDEVKAAITNGTVPDINAFILKRDALVQGIMDKLKATLTLDGSAQLNSFVRIEKARMKISATVSTAQ